LTRITQCWVGLILVQAVLGATTVWSNKAADVATLHVVVGAGSLALGALLTLLSSRFLVEVPETTGQSDSKLTALPACASKAAMTTI